VNVRRDWLASDLVGVTFNTAYLEQHVPVIRNRLQQAGVRLAQLLNMLLGR
jgi:hypothetical protein